MKFVSPTNCFERIKLIQKNILYTKLTHLMRKTMSRMKKRRKTGTGTKKKLKSTTAAAATETAKTEEDIEFCPKYSQNTRNSQRKASTT